MTTELPAQLPAGVVVAVRRAPPEQYNFAEPAEASVYYYLHHRFETVALDLLQQDGRSLRAVATVSDDLDGLGIDPVRADAWLTFTGILVSLHDRPLPMSR